jgi:ATP-dependent Clp protease ATP-binding subunit ClpA
MTREETPTSRGEGSEERRPTLVGRERELAAIADAVENPVDAPILELVGEPGIGKTALLEELLALGDKRAMAPTGLSLCLGNAEAH